MLGHCLLCVGLGAGSVGAFLLSVGHVAELLHAISGKHELHS
jgi:hypothetical protein